MVFEEYTTSKYVLSQNCIELFMRVCLKYKSVKKDYF